MKQYLDTPYDIDENGLCYSHLSNKYLTPQMTNKYPSYNLTINGKRKKIKIHRMVAETFLPKEEGKNIVNHIDGNTKNYQLSNLEWVNYSENSKHAIENGLKPKGNQNALYYTNDLDDERWSEIKGYKNYMISSVGRVMNKNTKRLLKPALSNYGYLEVNLWSNNQGKTHLIHKLVYAAFFDDYNLQGYVINHIDGNKTNNKINNLEKVSYQKNNLHAEYVIKSHKCAKPVGKYDLNNNLIESYPSIASAHKQTGINNISRAIKTNRYAGGFIWKFL